MPNRLTWQQDARLAAWRMNYWTKVPRDVRDAYPELTFLFDRFDEMAASVGADEAPI